MCKSNVETNRMLNVSGDNNNSSTSNVTGTSLIFRRENINLKTKKTHESLLGNFYKSISAPIVSRQRQEQQEEQHHEAMYKTLLPTLLNVEQVAYLIKRTKYIGNRVTPINKAYYTVKREENVRIACKNLKRIARIWCDNCDKNYHNLCDVVNLSYSKYSTVGLIHKSECIHCCSSSTNNGGVLKWSCSCCGAIRTLYSLRNHDCKKTTSRKALLAKFRRDNKKKALLWKRGKI